MLYSILCYNDEAMVGAWSKEKDAEVMAHHEVVLRKLTEQRKLGAVARLMPTTTATTLRETGGSVVIDGPFAETKEQLLGFYVVDCPTLDAAVATARDLRGANPTAVYEIRPISLFRPGTPLEARAES